MTPPHGFRRKFLTQQNRELFWRYKESWRENREFYRPKATHMMSALTPKERTSNAVRGLDPPEQHQNENDDQNRADETNAAMTVTVSIAAEAPAESAQQEDDKDNYKNKSQRHDFVSICGT
jgi:hypothetical protein